MPRISVLIPLYNTPENYLREAIESVLSQSFTDFELLLLNDSPDNTGLDAIVASYPDPRIRYMRNDKNLGISKSRNILLDQATGDYLAIMDHDDVSLPTRFEKQVAFLDANPEVGVVSCQFANYTTGTVSKKPIQDHDIKLELMRSCAISHSAATIRKSVLADNAIQYEERFSPAEDYGLWGRLISVTKFHNIDEALFRYRLHDGNTSKVQKRKMKNATLAVAEYISALNPEIYREFLFRATHTSVFRLFGFIPLFTVARKGKSTRIYLFKRIFIGSYKKSIRILD